METLNRLQSRIVLLQAEKQKQPSTAAVTYICRSLDFSSLFAEVFRSFREDFS